MCLISRTSLPRSLWIISSTILRARRRPKPPGRRPSSARCSAWASRSCVRVVGHGVRDAGGVEAGARVLDVVDDGARRPHRRDLDHLLGVELAAVLHGVHEDLAEGQHHLLALGLREVLPELRQEPDEPLHGEQAAVDAQGDPVGLGRDDLDPVVPVAWPRPRASPCPRSPGGPRARRRRRTRGSAAPRSPPRARPRRSGRWAGPRGGRGGPPRGTRDRPPPASRGW